MIRSGSRGEQEGGATRTVLAVLVALLASPAAGADETPLVEAVEGTFSVTLPGGEVRSGEDLEGAEFVLADRAGNRIEVRVAAVRSNLEDGPPLHDLRTRDVVTGAWRPLCDPDPNGGRWAIPLAGAWMPDGTYAPDAKGILLACTSGVAAKCVRMGYAPWGHAADGTPLLEAFQACTRMMRADYCGDGVAYTRNGTLINIEDRFGIQRLDPVPDLAFEAAWGPNGAVCVHHTRITENVTLEALLRACPRLEGRTGLACAPTTKGAILINQSQP